MPTTRLLTNVVGVGTSTVACASFVRWPSTDLPHHHADVKMQLWGSLTPNGSQDFGLVEIRSPTRSLFELGWSGLANTINTQTSTISAVPTTFSRQIDCDSAGAGPVPRTTRTCTQYGPLVIAPDTTSATPHPAHQLPDQPDRSSHHLHLQLLPRLTLHLLTLRGHHSLAHHHIHRYHQKLHHLTPVNQQLADSDLSHLATTSLARNTDASITFAPLRALWSCLTVLNFQQESNRT